MSRGQIGSIPLESKLLKAVRMNETLLCTVELLRVKTGLKIIVNFIPKEGLNGTRSAKPSFAMTPTIELLSVVFTHDILLSVSYQMKAWLG